MKALLDTHTFLHKDPFDRMLIAQAHFENIPILTSDSMIARYPVEVVWS